MNKLWKLFLGLILSAQVFAQSDNCSTATMITLSGGTACVNGTTIGATSNNTLYGGCNTGSVNEVWYTFVATGSQNDFSITSLGLTNAEIIIDADGCSNTSFETCNTVAGAATLNASWGIIPGTQVWIGIASNAGVEGNFQFCINSYNPSAGGGNMCSGAIPICASTYSVPTMAPFTASGQTPSCFLSACQQDIWLEVTILANGTFSWQGATLCNAEFDWALWNVTSGCPGTQVACNYNFAGGNSGTFGMVNGPGACSGEFCDAINVTAGQVYAIQIDNYSTFNDCGFNFTWLGTAQIAPSAAFTINPNTVTCGASVNVTIANTSVGIPDWDFGNGNTYTGSTPPAQTYSTPGTYAITATIPGACTVTASQFVQLYGPLAGTAAGVNATCPTSTNGSASVTSITGGNGVYTYSWSTGATTPSVSGLAPGNYTVTISNAVCGSSIILPVTIAAANTPGNPAFTFANYCAGSANGPVVTGTPGGTFAFNPVPGGGVTINSSTGVISGGVGGSTYTVQYTTPGPCPASSTQNVTVNAVGNPAFTFANYCQGSANSATVTGTPGGTFSFNPVPGGGVTINSSTGAISGGVGGTTYTVQYNTGGTCPAISTQNVTVNPLPVFTVAKTDPTTCGGTDGTIVISGLTNSTSYAVTYVDGGSTVGPTNYTSSGTGTITLTGLNAGTYNGFSITTNSTGCVGTNATILTLVEPGAPVLSITNPAPVCSPATVNLTAAAVTAGSTGGGVLSYWTNASATTALASPSSVTTSGTYYIQANNAGCIDIEPVTVTVNATPNLVITSPAAVCTPSTVDITAAAVTAGSTNATTLTYWNDAGATSTLSSPNALTASNTYYIQATNSGCTSIAPVVVTVNTTPNLTITNPAAVCSPLTVDITAAAVTAGSTNTGTLSYWNDAAATSSLSTPGGIATSNTYYIQATNAGCTDIAPVVVTVNSTPVLTITDPAAVCSPLTVDITVAAVTAGSTNPGTLSYWNDAGATSTLSSPNALATSNTYYIQATNSGCTSIAPVVVTVNTTPNLTITNPAAVCSPLTVDITAAAVTAGSANTGTLSYWNDAAATSALATPGAITTSNTYYIQATNTGCTDIAPVVVTVNTTPVLTITDPAAVCSPLTVDITAAAVTAGSTNTGTLTYWNDAAATSTLSAASGVTTSGTYYIQASNSGCTDIAPVIVTVNTSPVLTINNPSAVCAPATIDITAAAITAGSTNAGTLSYWNDAAATTSLSTPSAIGSSGTYYIQATNAGCTDIATVTVVVNPVPGAPTAGTDATYCSSWAISDMTATGGAGTMTWYLDAGLSTIHGTGGSIAPINAVSTTTYYVTETALGCEGPASTVTIVIQDCEIFVPTAFTPDGDGVHDNWEIVDLDQVYPDNVVTVFNRWGAKIYESEQGNYAGNPWDGTFEGNALPVASYYFIIDFNLPDVDPQKGIVSIVLSK